MGGWLGCGVNVCPDPAFLLPDLSSFNIIASYIELCYYSPSLPSEPVSEMVHAY
ncbi:hypothetical protein RSJ42_00775 [Methanosarcina hadiensis]|uniref:hypothetical protein n=1 Tax=Methanosarcina hadiensis TaxID=3078083 RepID=UPI0039775F2B